MTSNEHDYFEIFLDSDSSDNADYNRPTFYLDPPIKNCIGVKVIGATIPFSWYVINSLNGTFTLSENIGNYIYNTGTGLTVPKQQNYTITISPGNYDAISIKTELDTKMSIVKPFVYTIDSTNDSIDWYEHKTGQTSLHCGTTKLTHGTYLLSTFLPLIGNVMTAGSTAEGFGYTYTATKPSTKLVITKTTTIAGDVFNLTFTCAGIPWYYFGAEQKDYPFGEIVTLDSAMPVTSTTTYAMTYDYNNSKITITSTVAEKWFITIAASEASPRWFLGGELLNTSAADGILIFPNTAELTGSNYILLNGSIGTLIFPNTRVNGQSTFSPPVLAKIPVTVNPGGEFNYIDAQVGNYYFDYGGNTLQTLEFYFSLGDYQIPKFLDFNGRGFSINLGVITTKQGTEVQSQDLNVGSKRVRINY